MRRQEKEVVADSDIESIINKCKVCRLGMLEKDTPYIVPLCFGYQDKTLYFHCAGEGKKNDLLKQNPRVCFEFDIMLKITTDENACDWGMKFQSVIGWGMASFIEEPDEKKAALDIVMAQYSKKKYSYTKEMLDKTAVFRVKIDHMTAKQSL